MTLKSLAIAAAACLALPALAKDKAAPNVNAAGSASLGSVAQLMLAQDLYALGLAGKDAATVLAAARLATAVTLREVAREKEVTGPEVAGQETGAIAPIDAATMLATARELAGEDETLAEMIDAAEIDALRGNTLHASATLSHLGAGQTDRWQIAFFGDSHTELAVLGDGDGNLDVLVTDENDNTICFDVSWSDRIFCDFVPAWNGYFQVTVQNNGTRQNSYYLLTN